MLERSAFNSWVRDLWSVLLDRQQEVVKWLESGDEVYDGVDCLPIPVDSKGQAQREKDTGCGLLP